MPRRKPEPEMRDDYTQAERLDLVRAVDEYRTAHPRDMLENVLDAATKGELTAGRYYAWRQSLVRAGKLEALPASEKYRAKGRHRKAKEANGKAKANGHAEPPPTMEFPLMPIERPPARPKAAKAAVRVAELIETRSDRGKLAALLRALADML